MEVGAEVGVDKLEDDVLPPVDRDPVHPEDLVHAVLTPAVAEDTDDQPVVPEDI